MIALSSQMFPDPKLKAFFTDKVLEQKKNLPGVQARQAVEQHSCFLPVSSFGLERHGALARRSIERYRASVGGRRCLFGSEGFQGLLGEGELVLCVFHGGKVVLLFKIR
jgi:hypothetical protein